MSAPEATAETPFLSVVVPVFRTAWALPELARRLRVVAAERGWSYELVAVDDASPDGGAAAAARLAAEDPAVRPLPLPANAGQHRAVLAGLAAARGRWVAVLDGDLQDPPEAIPRLLERAAEGYDAVFAARVGSYQEKRRMATSRLFKALLARLCGLPRGAGMCFVASRRLVDRLVAWHDPEPWVVAMIGLAGLPVSALPVVRERRPRGRSAYSGRRRLEAGLAAVRFALRWRGRAPGADGGDPPPRVSPLRVGAGAALLVPLATAVIFLEGRGQALDLGDEGFRYLLSRAWAEGGDLHRLFHLLYPAGQYAYFGLALRLSGPGLDVLRLAGALLGGLAVALLFASVRRLGSPAVAWAAAAAIALSCAATFATAASALVFALALDVAIAWSRDAPAVRPAAGKLIAIATLAGWLADWREDSAVLAAVLAVIVVALRRRPRELLTRAAPAALAGFVPWLVLAALRGETAGLLAHVGHRLAFLVARLGAPTHPGWHLRLQPPDSPRSLAIALFPLLAVLPPLVYAGLLAGEAVRRRRGRGVRLPVAAAALVGVAYLPQFLWERPDVTHLRAHVHLLIAVVAVAAASLDRRRLRGLGVAALAGLALAAAAYKILENRRSPTVLYPCCEGRRIGARVPAPPPPWAGLSSAGGRSLVVLGWGPGWYVVEGLRPATRFLYTGERNALDPAALAEVRRDLERPAVRWVITREPEALPPDLREALARAFRQTETWNGWRLWQKQRAPD